MVDGLFLEFTVFLILIFKGCDPDGPAGDGTTPFHWAVYGGSRAAAEWLRAHRGCDAGAVNAFGCNAAQFASGNSFLILAQHASCRCARELRPARGEMSSRFEQPPMTRVDSALQCCRGEISWRAMQHVSSRVSSCLHTACSSRHTRSAVGGPAVCHTAECSLRSPCCAVQRRGR